MKPNKYYIEILDMMKESPVFELQRPFAASFSCQLSFPELQAVEFYKALRELVAFRVEKGIGATKDERVPVGLDILPSGTICAHQLTWRNGMHRSYIPLCIRNMGNGLDPIIL